MVNNDITRRNHRWTRSAGLAGMTLVIAAVIGTALAERPAEVDLLTTPVDLLALPSTSPDFLGLTVVNFNDANQALSNIDLTLHPAFEPFIDAQISTQNLMVQNLNELLQAQDTISSNDAPLQFLGDGLFNLYNLAWYLDSGAVLSMAQGMDTALASDLWGVAGLAEIALYALDFQGFAGAVAGFPILFASTFF